MRLTLLWTLLVWLVLPGLALAADGDSCTSNIKASAGGAASQITCKKLCDAKNSGALTCAAVLVPSIYAATSAIAIETTGGCAYDSVVVAEYRTSTTSGIAVKSIGILDDDATAPDGSTGITQIHVTGRAIGPYLAVTSGTLATCSTATFAIWIVQWQNQSLTQ